jgi:hypothetical protein
LSLFFFVNRPEFPADMYSLGVTGYIVLNGGYYFNLFIY